MANRKDTAEESPRPAPAPGPVPPPAPASHRPLVVSYKDVWCLKDRPSESFDACDPCLAAGVCPSGHGAGPSCSTTSSGDICGAGSGSIPRCEDSSEAYMNSPSCPTAQASIRGVLAGGGKRLSGSGLDRKGSDSASAWSGGKCRSGGGSRAPGAEEDFEFRAAAGDGDPSGGWPHWRRMADSVHSMGTEDGKFQGSAHGFKSLPEKQNSAEDAVFLEIKFDWEDDQQAPAVTYEERVGKKGGSGRGRCRKGLRLLRSLVRSDGKSQKAGRRAKGPEKDTVLRCIGCLWGRSSFLTATPRLKPSGPSISTAPNSTFSAPCGGSFSPLTTSPLPDTLPASPRSMQAAAPDRSPGLSQEVWPAWHGVAGTASDGRDHRSEIREQGAQRSDCQIAQVGPAAPFRRSSASQEASISLDLFGGCRLASASFEGWEAAFTQPSTSMGVSPAWAGGHAWRPPVLKSDEQYEARHVEACGGGGVRSANRVSDDWAATPRLANAASPSAKVSMDGSVWDERTIPEFDPVRLQMWEPEDGGKRSVSFSDFGGCLRAT
ncbi:unnamed protein product [Ostreobium quekettii]|uniref:Uncharacterized protein n=1 Tax=Ostreobium quekettii TaxID=121088 RepID=A0A8S1IWB7_9CHLO|nr:unnamed protein product [Ostreobium quekettii]